MNISGLMLDLLIKKMTSDCLKSWLSTSSGYVF